MKLLSKIHAYEDTKLKIECNVEEMRNLQVFVFEDGTMIKQPYKVFADTVEIIIPNKREKSTIIQLSLKNNEEILYTKRMRIPKKRNSQNQIVHDDQIEPLFHLDDLNVDVNEISKKAIFILQGKVAD